MVNKRLLEIAEKWKNPSLPDEKTQQEKAKTSNLVHILERDSEGKPKLNLNPLEKTAVNTPTQEEYNTLMGIYECGGWKWPGGRSPTQDNYWNRYKKETCIDAETYKDDLKGKFGFADKGFYRRERYQIISTQEFYDKQKITQENINEINQWFKYGK